MFHASKCKFLIFIKRNNKKGGDNDDENKDIEEFERKVGKERGGGEGGKTKEEDEKHWIHNIKTNQCLNICYVHYCA